MHLISRTKSCVNGNIQVVTAGGFLEACEVQSSSDIDVTRLESNHIEADTRIILHASVLKSDEYERVIFAARDTDVLLLLLYTAPQSSDQLWL